MRILKHKQETQKWLLRQDMIDKANKWAHFKVKRVKTIEKYVAQRKIQEKAYQFIIQMKLDYILKKVRSNMLLKKLHDDMKFAVEFVSIKLYCRFRVHIKKSGQKFDQRMAIRVK